VVLVITNGVQDMTVGMVVELLVIVLRIFAAGCAG
jgi:hypothetical protein